MTYLVLYDLFSHVSLYDLFYELQCVASWNFIFLWPDDGLMVEAETCHLIT